MHEDDAVRFLGGLETGLEESEIVVARPFHPLRPPVPGFSTAPTPPGSAYSAKKRVRP